MSNRQSILAALQKHGQSTTREIRHFHMFGAIGGGAKGFNRGKARVGNLVAKFRCLGSVDVDAAANRDFQRLVGVPATTLDLFDRDQYIAFHGKEPPAGWREAIPADIRAAAGRWQPNPPCRYRATYSEVWHD